MLGATPWSPSLLLAGDWDPARAVTVGVGVALLLKPPPAEGAGLGPASCLGLGRGVGARVPCSSGPWPGLVCRGPSGPAAQSAQGPPGRPSLLVEVPVAFAVPPRGKEPPLGPGAPPGTWVRVNRAMGRGWQSWPPRAGGGPVRPLRTRNTRPSRMLLCPLGCVHWGAAALQLTRCQTRLCIHRTSG